MTIDQGVAFFDCGSKSLFSQDALKMTGDFRERGHRQHE